MVVVADLDQPLIRAGAARRQDHEGRKRLGTQVILPKVVAVLNYDDRKEPRVIVLLPALPAQAPKPPDFGVSGPPGWSTIWRGWYEIMLMGHGAELLAPIAEGGTCV